MIAESVRASFVIRRAERRFGVTGCCAGRAGGRVPITQIWVPATRSTSLSVDGIMAASRRLPAAAVSAVFDCADIVFGSRHGCYAARARCGPPAGHETRPGAADVIRSCRGDLGPLPGAV